MFTDNPDFYPTPRKVIELMWSKIQNKDARYILEPSTRKETLSILLKKKISKNSII